MLGLAGTHGDAEHVVVVEAHSAGKGGDVAVVGDYQGHVAYLLRSADVDVLDLLVELVLRHLEEEGSDHGAVLDVDAGGRDADGVHARHVGGGGLEGVHDALEVIVRVGCGFGEPDDLFGEHALAVDDGGDLAVGAAGVEADAAAGKVTAYGLRVGLLCGELGAGNDLKGPLVDAGHEVSVEGTAAFGGVGGADVFVNALVAADIDLPAAEEPEHGLDHAVGVVFVRLCEVGRAVNEGIHNGNLAARALDGYAEALLCALEESGVELVQGDIVLVQFGDVFNVYLNSKMLHV